MAYRQMLAAVAAAAAVAAVNAPSPEAAVAAVVDTVFGESRYEESAWLRGVYLTSATQEGFVAPSTSKV